ncbi:MAG: hypothetical protein MJB14_02400 [Spirochaetes bacterium]|nr:hypothetical protein [Spirochaetota bacterium]
MKNPKKQTHYQIQAKQWSLDQLAGMIKYFETSNLVEEDARSHLLDKLNAVFSEWQNKNWKEIIP